MGENEPVKEGTCEERREAQGAQVKLMFEQIQRDVKEIKSDVKELKTGASGFVSWEAFRDKCREIEELKKFNWKTAGVASIIPTLIAALGLILKFVK